MKVLHINLVAQYGPDFLALCYAIPYNVNWPLKVRFPQEFMVSYLTFFSAHGTPDNASFEDSSHQSIQASFAEDVLTGQHFWFRKLFEANETFKMFF